MKKLNFEETIKGLKDFGYCFPNPVRFEFQGAEQYLRLGLNYFCGGAAQWLPQYAAVAEWLSDNKGRGLLLMGSCGLGKTLIAGKLIPLLLYRYKRIAVIPFTAAQMNAKTDVVMSKRAVYIDDIGTENESVIYGQRRNAFAEVCDNAERKGNMLLLTTNLSVEELCKKYGARVYDRLRSITQIVEIKGQSLRK